MDYTSFSEDGTLKPRTNEDDQWWKLRGDELAGAISGVIQFLDTHQNRIARDVELVRLYGNASLMGLNGLSSSQYASINQPQRDRVTYNAIASAVDTVTAKIAKHRPRPLFLTNGGDYKMQTKAKRLDKWVSGVFYENNAYEEGTRIFKDGACWGDGMTYVYNCFGRIKFERVLPMEVKVDEVEGMMGNPRQLHRVKEVDRNVLAAWFPDARKLIMEAPRSSYGRTSRGQNISDTTTVRESWHLPSKPGAKDGKRAITLGNGTIDVFDWKRDHFPFARFCWNPRQIGYWSQGGVEQCESLQMQVNKVMWLMQRSFHLAGTFKILLENGSKTVPSHFNNDVGAIIHYTGTKPEYVVPPVMPAEAYNYLLQCKQSIYEQFGVSQLSSTAQKPAGLDSGKALREYQDIESERFMVVGQNYERYYLELAELAVEEMREMAEADPKMGNYEVQVPEKRNTVKVNWKDVDLAEDDYVMKLYPISSLPSSPEGQLATIAEYIQAGMMKPRTGRRLLNFPDLDAQEELDDAQENYLHKIIEQMIEDDVYTPPEPYDDLDLALELGLEYYAQGKTNGLEEAKLDHLRQFIEDVKLKKAGADMGAQQLAAAQNVPQANPMAPPTSQLVPNVPGIAA